MGTIISYTIKYTSFIQGYYQHSNYNTQHPSTDTTCTDTCYSLSFSNLSLTKCTLIKLIIFSRFSATKQGNEYEGSFYFEVDGVFYSRKEAWFPDSRSIPSGSATVILELQAGETVAIANYGSTRIYGTYLNSYYQSWFTGSLLYAL